MMATTSRYGHGSNNNDENNINGNSGSSNHLLNKWRIPTATSSASSSSMGVVRSDDSTDRSVSAPTLHHHSDDDVDGDDDHARNIVSRSVLMPSVTPSSQLQRSTAIHRSESSNRLANNNNGNNSNNNNNGFGSGNGNNNGTNSITTAATTSTNTSTSTTSSATLATTSTSASNGTSTTSNYINHHHHLHEDDDLRTSTAASRMLGITIDNSKKDDDTDNEDTNTTTNDDDNDDDDDENSIMMIRLDGGVDRLSSSSTASLDTRPAKACFTGRTRITVIACVVFILFVAYATYKLPVNEWSKEFLLWIPTLGFWGPLVFIVSYALFTVFFLPILPLTLASGVLFGVALGTIYSWIGAVFGGCVAFVLGKQVFSKCALEMAESFPQFAAIDRAISGNSWKIVLFLRLSPLIPFNVMSYILSLTQIGFVSYTSATAAGVLVPTSACVWVGAAASSISEVLANPTKASVGLLVGGTILSIISLAIITKSSTRAIQSELRKVRERDEQMSINV
jgi:uncharacterized membrane protein YdjX (TVP38/TMEM64 family)